MQRSYKFRIYPSKQEEEKLRWTLDQCRFVYNQMLEGLNKQKKPNRNELQKSIPELKEVYPGLKNVYSKVLQYEPYRLFSNLRSLSRLKKKGKKVGSLRFKGAGWFKTITYNQSGFKLLKTGKRCDGLHLSKIGDIKIRAHREVAGHIKQITVKQYRSGKWFALFSVTKELPESKIMRTQKQIGIDLGLMNYVHDSDGTRVDHPHYLNESLKRLQKQQRRLSRKKKRSNNRTKQKLKVAIVHEKVLNQRNDFLHKLSHMYVNNYGMIAVEKLNIKGLIKISYNVRNLMDASWNKFLQMLRYKAESAGTLVIEVNPRGTSQKCSSCGQVVKKTLSVRTHNCPYCGLVLDRDHNAAINILKRAVGQGLPEFTPVEISVGELQKQEAPIFN